MSTVTEAFPGIEKIRYEGPDSVDPLSFRWYNAEEFVEGKRMREHLRFSVVFWHTFRGNGMDPFGMPTLNRPWDDGSSSLENARRRVAVAFEFMEKLGAEFYAFHDRDVAPEGADLAETNKNLDAIADELEQQQQRTGIQLLWGTANLFSHPRYMHGAATSCNADVFCYAAAQVGKAIEITQRLGGENYVFWGGREGYQNLFNTDMKRELDHLATFLGLAVDYAAEIGFTGQFLLEPKPHEPTKHQYDTDAAACINFLHAYDLLKHFKLNIETNHATLAGHSMMHELEYAASQGMLGSIDANTGDELLGWDTDQFPTNYYLTTQIMLTLLKYQGITPGGVNFDAKVRRESTDPVDLFHAHIGAMDAFAKGLKIAAAIRADRKLDDFLKQRYSSWDVGIGADIEKGRHTFKSLSTYMLDKGEAEPNESGRQEMLENLFNQYLQLHRDRTMPRDIPELPQQFNTPKPTGGASSTAKILIIVLCAVVGGALLMACCCLAPALLMPGFQQARNAAQRADALNRARIIGLALQNYHETHGEFPPVYRKDDSGNPLYSWRALLLPYMEMDSIYREMDLDQPWDSTANAVVRDLEMTAYQSLRCERVVDGATNFVAVVGPGTVFDPEKTNKIAAINDGTISTGIFIELPSSDTQWMEPQDVSIEEAIEIIKNNPFPSGVIVGMADGSAMIVRKDMSEENIRNLFLINDGNIVDLN